MARKSKKFKLDRRAALISAAGLVVVVAVGLGLWHHHNKPSQEVIESTPSKSSLTANSSSNGNSSSGSSSGSDKQVANDSSSGSTVDNPTDGTSNPPATPTGDFVSSHHVGLNTQEQSACVTSPGASCYIKLVNGNQTKTLSAQLADANGGAIWNWNTSELSAGSWQVSAVATLNGQTKTTVDQMPLVVSQ